MDLARVSLFQRLRRRMVFFLTFSDTDLIELESASFTSAWGLWVLWPGHNFTNAAVLLQLLQYMPQWLIGGIVLLCGLFQFTGLIGTWSFCRRWGNLTAFMVWIFLAALGFLEPSAPPSTVIYLILAASSGAAYLRIGHYFVIRA